MKLLRVSLDICNKSRTCKRVGMCLRCSTKSYLIGFGGLSLTFLFTRFTSFAFSFYPVGTTYGEEEEGGGAEVEE